VRDIKIYKNSSKIFKFSLLLLGIAVIFSGAVAAANNDNTTTATVVSNQNLTTDPGTTSQAVADNSSATDQVQTNNSTNINTSKTDKSSNSLNSKKNQTSPDPQIYNGGVPVARGGNPAGYDYPTIAAAIANALSGDTIMLENGATFDENGLVIDKNLNFNVLNVGKATIDGQNLGTIFIIDNGVTVNLQNLIIENGQGTNGGGIYNNGTLTITNCTFTGNNAQNGGAIYNDATINITDTTLTGITIPANGGTLIVINSTFTGNTATGNGGAIYNGGLITITGSTLTSDTANYNGGTATVTGSTFKGNTAQNGGVIYNDATITITDSSTLTTSIVTHNGGTLTINNSSIIGNVATGNGGAIYNGGIITITGSTLTGSTAQNGGTLNVNNSTITGNQALNGGSIYNDALITVANSTLTGSTAQNGGTFTITNNTITNTAATQNGGGLDNEATINATNNTFTTNTVTNGGGTLTVTNSTITGNTAPNGAAIYNNASIIDLNNSGANTVANGGTVTATPNYWGSNNGPATGDMAGNEPVTVTPWLETSTVTNVDPAKGSMNINANQVIIITFSDPVAAGSAYNSITVNRADGVPKAITKTINGNTLTITSIYGWEPGTIFTINLPANSIVNAAGVGLNTFASTFTTASAPIVASVSPVNGAKGLPTNQVIIITFSDPVAAGSAYNSITVNRADGVPKAITKTINGNTLTITSIYGWEPGTIFTINLPANSIVNAAGVGLNTYASTFTTASAPIVASVSPASGAKGLPTNQVIIITFSDPVAAGSAYNSITVNRADGVPKAITKTINGNTLTITSIYGWEPGTTFTINLPANSIVNAAGVGLNTYASTFTTA
jgi:predicted outer membrane repeat protein